MRKIVSATILLLLCHISFAQKIHFSDTTNRWNTYVYDCYNNGSQLAHISYSYSGDTTIAGITYHKLVQSIYPLFIYEDTIGNKVYAKYALDTPQDTSLHILYDYNLNLNDRFKVYWINPPTVFHVDHKDSTLINNIWYKTWHFRLDASSLVVDQDTSTDDGFTVIEGLGCLTQPQYPLLGYVVESCERVACFYNHGTQPLVTPTVDDYFDNATSCSLYTSVNTLNQNSQLAKVVPDPIDGSGKIILPGSMSGSIIIINALGQKIYTSHFQNQDAISIGGKITQPGMYYYRVTDENSGHQFTGKFVSR